uniref:Uncharacterized protein n=1 Tax=Arundo donax TaxID=35708 RepID=A0A0A9HAW1_ARUDO
MMNSNLVGQKTVKHSIGYIFLPRKIYYSRSSYVSLSQRSTSSERRIRRLCT